MENIQDKFTEILVNEPLASYTTFHIGGIADFFYKSKNIHKLQELIEYCDKNKIRFFILGAGSNILFDDNGFRGLVIKIEFNEIKLRKDYIEADAGVLVSDLVNTSIEHGYTGLEAWTGLPGTLGAAIRGNAGCNGLEIKDRFISAKVLDIKTYKITEYQSEYFEFQYRHSSIKHNKNIILSAKIKIEKDKKGDNTKKNIQEIQKLRFKTQPFGVKTTGSFFKNPSPDKAAGFLVDQSGLKGKTIGGAQISEKHANFFINKSKAKSKDIIALSSLAKAKVKEKFNIDLEEEIEIIAEN